MSVKCLKCIALWIGIAKCRTPDVALPVQYLKYCRLIKWIDFYKILGLKKKWEGDWKRGLLIVRASLEMKPSLLFTR